MSEVVGCRVGRRQRDAQDGVGAQLALVRRAVKQCKLPVEAHLVQRVGPDDLLGYLAR